MPDFTVRSDSINVEQIMEQIRARIREKRGVDYTEQQIRELATVKLEKFLDPRALRSDLLEQYRRLQQTPPPPPRPPFEPTPRYEFEEHTLYHSHRVIIRWIRRLLQPILKLFFNPNVLIQILHVQAQINAVQDARAARAELDAAREAAREAEREAIRRELDQLQYETLHNLVVEMTRTGIEVKNLKMRVESLTSRLEFNERRARALESVVVYRPADDVPDTSAGRGQAATTSAVPGIEPSVGSPGHSEGPGQRSRRRRRRRGRRGNGSAVAIMGATGSSPTPSAPAGLDPVQESATGGTDAHEKPAQPSEASALDENDPDQQ
jgi:hypothetical protein